MSSDFYFRKWKQTLVDLEATVNLDIHLQETKAHDKKRCEATKRLSGVLSRYKQGYNDVWECLHQNLQLQKTSYMRDVLRAVVARIMELKYELQKLETSEYHFGSNGLIDHKLMLDNAQLVGIPDFNERPDNIQTVIKQVYEHVKERKKQIEEEAARTETTEGTEVDWWDIDNMESSEDTFNFNTDTKKNELSEEQKQTKRMALLIQSQEKSRRVIAEIIQTRNKRVKWAKELAGTLQPPARYEIRHQAANLIQQVCRTYFDLKRQKVKQCKRDELIGYKPCLQPKLIQQQKLEQIRESRVKLKRKYEEKWKKDFECYKQDFLKKKSDQIREDYRDYLRDWFKTWYESIDFFYDIPKEKYGGATLIFKGETPTPEEWLEEYNVYLAEKKANKGKSAMDKKFAKQDAKREEMERKRAETMKEKMEEQMRRKMMKNPSLHPGFHFPMSKKTKNILEAIDNYYKDWSDLDAKETPGVKEKCVKSVDMSNVFMEAKMEIVSTVEDDMRKELKLLKKALKTNYENKDEEMPEPMKQKYKKLKKAKKFKNTLGVNTAEKLEDLVFHGHMLEYPKTNINDFIGDPNFAGDDLRCDYVEALPDNGETRSLWWDKCRELSQGFHKILLVGPKGSGKTTLVNAMATLNDAVLFELNPVRIQGIRELEAYLGHLVQSVASCARAVQPSVIHVKHVHRLFYRKVPPEDAEIDWKLIQGYFIKKLFKSIQKTDKVTVVGSCMDPWVTNSNKVLKQFSTVVLLPNTSYGTVTSILKDWVLSYTVIPADLDVSCLAQVLRGYSFGYLKTILKKFMTAETITRIAARGLSPMEIYDYIIQDGTEEKVEYENYVQWYNEKTEWGRRGQRHQQEQLAFKQALADYELKMEKKKKAKQN